MHLPRSERRPRGRWHKLSWRSRRRSHLCARRCCSSRPRSASARRACPCSASTRSTSSWPATGTSRARNAGMPYGRTWARYACTWARAGRTWRTTCTSPLGATARSWARSSSRSPTSCGCSTTPDSQRSANRPSCVSSVPSSRPTRRMRACALSRCHVSTVVPSVCCSTTTTSRAARSPRGSFRPSIHSGCRSPSRCYRPRWAAAATGSRARSPPPPRRWCRHACSANGSTSRWSSRTRCTCRCM